LALVAALPEYVAALPEYQVPKNEALELSRWAQGNRLSVREALIRCGEVPGLTDPGRMGLRKLGMQLKGLEYASPLIRPIHFTYFEAGQIRFGCHSAELPICVSPFD
jgi:hypothetical protein